MLVSAWSSGLVRTELVGKKNVWSSTWTWRSAARISVEATIFLILNFFSAFPGDQGLSIVKFQHWGDHLNLQKIRNICGIVVHKSVHWNQHFDNGSSKPGLAFPHQIGEEGGQIWRFHTLSEGIGRLSGLGQPKVQPTLKKCCKQK